MIPRLCILVLIAWRVGNCEELSNPFGDHNDQYWSDQLNVPIMNALTPFLSDHLSSSLDKRLVNEILSSFVFSFKICQRSFDEAEEKVSKLLEVYDEANDFVDSFEENGVISNVSRKSQENDHLFLVNDILHESIMGTSEIVNTMDINPPSYIHDIKKFIRAINHACTSLPTAVPSVHQRHKRNPQKVLERLASSLTRWSKRWFQSFENKLNAFLTSCLSTNECKLSIEKLISSLVTFFKRHENSFTEQSSGILKDLLRQLSDSENPSMKSLSYFQKMVLGMKATPEDLEEESAFGMAEKITNFGVTDYLERNSQILTKLLNLKTKASVLQTEVTELEIETEKLVAEVPDTFLSLAFSIGLIEEDWGIIKTRLPRFLKIASSLSPAILRVGGTRANFMTYEPSSTHPKVHPKYLQVNQRSNSIVSKAPKIQPKSKNHPKYILESNQILENFESGAECLYGRNCNQDSFGKHFTNFTMYGSDWAFLVNLVHKLDWTLLFDLNQRRRDHNGHWDYTNAQLIFNDPLSSKIPIIWQLGNEPNHYQHHFKWNISGKEDANDYQLLQKELNNSVLKSTRIVGPDVTRPHVLNDVGDSSISFLEDFLEAGGSQVVNAVTWHQYNLDGHTATLEDFITSKNFDVFPRQLQQIALVRDKYAKEKPIWITETASAYGGGAPDLSDQYAGVFLWLDKLGAAALGGVSNVFRQTLYSGNYALLDDSLRPNPTFWVTVLHKHLVGNGVLLPRTRMATDHLRVYAQCLNSKHPMFKTGSVVIFAMNFSEKPKTLRFHGDQFKNSSKFLYELSPQSQDLKSREVLLNGRRLKLSDDGALPKISPVKDPNESLVLSPWAMSFWAFVDAGVEVCRG